MREVEERAERLRVLIELAPFLPAGPEEAAALLSAEDSAVLDRLTSEDLDLANACLAVEVELRAEGFARLERLAALVTARGPGGSLDERLEALPSRVFADAALVMIALGWVEP